MRRKSFSLPVPMLLAAAVASGACGKPPEKFVVSARREGTEADAGGKRLSKGARVAADGEAKPKPVPTSRAGTPVMADEEALDFLRDNCSTCHNDPKAQPAISSWSVGRFGLADDRWKAFLRDETQRTKFLRELEVEPTLPRVYQSMINKLDGKSDASPSPMPQNASPKGLRAATEWMEARFPFAVHEALVTFQKKEAPPPPLDFSCEGPVRAKIYIRRVVNEAFDREPTIEELGLAVNPEAPVDDALREKVRKRFRDADTWGAEFRKKTLRKFALRLGGAAELGNVGGDDFFDPAAAPHLAEEFYQLLLRNADKSYMETLLTDTFPMTKLTRPLYAPGRKTALPQVIERDAAGKATKVAAQARPAPETLAFNQACAAPLADDLSRPEAWVDCKPGDRKTYFSSLSFLNSRRSSFLGENNNYGRVGELITFITGESIRPATQGITQGDKRPTPACFVSKDYRSVKVADGVAPRGTLAIPHAGRSCQGCHFDRYLAAGSVVFRRFLGNGEILTAETVAALGAEVGGLSDAERALFFAPASGDSRRERRLFNALESAIDKETWKNADPAKPAPAPIDLAFLGDLLRVGTVEKACVVDADGVERPVEDVESLARVLMGPKGVNLSRGLAWHIPRVLSGAPVTTTEVVEVFRETWQKEGGKLLPLFESYFTSNTFSCRAAVSGGTR